MKITHVTVRSDAFKVGLPSYSSVEIPCVEAVVELEEGEDALLVYRTVRASLNRAVQQAKKETLASMKERA